MKNRFIEILKILKFKIINKNFFSLNNKLKLSEENSYNNVTIELSPHLIKAKKIEDIEFLCNDIRYFLQVLENNCKNFDGTLFENNIKKVMFNIAKINDNSSERITGSVVWYNNVAKNLILKNKKPIFHEFLHLSTNFITNSDGEILYNEGYTQLLEKRYFNHNKNAYVLETIIMSYIETIIGKDYMEHQFFRGNLKQTITELEKYTSKENVKTLLENMGRIYHINNRENIFMYQVLFQQCLDSVYNILSNCLKEKINETDNLNEKLMLIKSFLPFSVTFNNSFPFKFGNLDEYNKLLNSILLNEDLEDNKISKK